MRSWSFERAGVGRYNDNAVGALIAGIEARLAKPAGGAATPGEVGELHVRGPNVMRGYYRAPEATAAVIDQDDGSTPVISGASTVTSCLSSAAPRS